MTFSGSFLCFILFYILHFFYAFFIMLIFVPGFPISLYLRIFPSFIRNWHKTPILTVIILSHVGDTVRGKVYYSLIWRRENLCQNRIFNCQNNVFMKFNMKSHHLCMKCIHFQFFSLVYLGAFWKLV